MAEAFVVLQIPALRPAQVDLHEPNTTPTISARTLTESTGGLRARLSRSWRRMPLTAQLGALGALVTLAWFLTARVAADRVEAQTAARNEQLNLLRAADGATARLLTAATGMNSAQRGFVLGGGEALAVRYEMWRRSFEQDANLLREYLPTLGSTAVDLDRLVSAVEQLDREVGTPNFTAYRLRGDAAFGPGTPGRARQDEATRIYDEIRFTHGQLTRDVREAIVETQRQAELESALEEWENFLIRIAAVAIFLLLLVLLLRVVGRSLERVIRGAEALDAGNYEAARLPHVHTAPSRDMARLALTFERLAQSIETRERQLQSDIEQLKELERLKTDFVSTVSHELRTPLTSMRGALGLMLGGASGDLNPKGRDLLRIALTNTDRLIRLINDILDIEKIDAGHVSIRRDQLKIAPLLESTIAGLDNFAHDAGVTLSLAPVARIPVNGDSDRLTQVFTNLISNAVKFSPKGSSVEVAATEAAGEVRITVRDHGPGIPSEFASRIFGRFQQAGGAASRRSGGTGLGLAISKAITELHGGRIGFQDAPGGGTVFWVALPVAPRAPEGALEGHGVLIVEDDESMRAVLSALIEPFARPIPAGDAVAALRALETDQVRVIILDTGLPGMDGLSFARKLRQDPRFRTLSILLYSATGFAPEDLKDSGIRIADAFVKTRDTEASLVDRVRRELQGLP
ncbi:MAG: hybrid sensor histidine kinase/response regulator [Gemmatimonadaceae bacterium]|nr:hybrid sensor histidine kinase/response regulator [Gemmatimonadaceae bacterium]